MKSLRTDTTGKQQVDTLPEDTNAIRTLTADEAQILARRTGTLSLNGLADLPDAIARLLIRRIAPLALDGLPALSLELAKTLARFHGALSLSGLSSLTPEAAAAIDLPPSAIPVFKLGIHPRIDQPCAVAEA